MVNYSAMWASAKKGAGFLGQGAKLVYLKMKPVYNKVVPFISGAGAHALFAKKTADSVNEVGLEETVHAIIEKFSPTPSFTKLFSDLSTDIADSRKESADRDEKLMNKVSEILSIVHPNTVSAALSEKKSYPATDTVTSTHPTPEGNKQSPPSGNESSHGIDLSLAPNTNERDKKSYPTTAAPTPTHPRPEGSKQSPPSGNESSPSPAGSKQSPPSGNESSPSPAGSKQSSRN